MKKKYALISLIILIIFTKYTKEDDELKKERIKSTLNLILNSINSDIYEKSFSLNYIKYKIKFSVFKISNPLEEDIIINEIEPNCIYQIQNITILFNYNNYVIVDDNDNIPKVEDSSKIIEIKYDEIVFKQDNNILYLQETNISSINYTKIAKIKHLRYFKDYNEGKVKPKYSEIDDYFDVDEILKMGFDKIFKNRIEDIFDNINLYYFDINRILYNTTYKNIDCSEKYPQYFIHLKSIYITDTQVPISNVKMIDNSLYIYYLNIKGYFTFYNGEFVEFNIFLQEDTYFYLNKNGIFYLNPHQPFKIVLTDSTLDEYTDEFLYIGCILPDSDLNTINNNFNKKA